MAAHNLAIDVDPPDGHPDDYDLEAGISISTSRTHLMEQLEEEKKPSRAASIHSSLKSSIRKTRHYCSYVTDPIFTILRKFKLLILLAAYSFFGAWLFMTLEVPTDLKNKEDKYHSRLIARDVMRLNLRAIYLNNREDREERWKDAIMIFERDLGLDEPSLDTSWTFWMAFLYAGTIYTTIGYGNIACTTTGGRVATCLYALVGIPIMIVMLNGLGEFLLIWLKRIATYSSDLWLFMLVKLGVKTLKESTDEYRRFKRISKVLTSAGLINEQSVSVDTLSMVSTLVDDDAKSDDEEIEPDPPVISAFFVTVGWILLSAAVFCLFEDWEYFTSIYFCFISLSTIGLGDVTPSHPEYMISSYGMVIVGLSLVTVFIDVVKEKLELMLMRLLKALLKDYMDAIANGDPNAAAGMMSGFQGGAKFLMPFMTKSQGAKVMNQFKEDCVAKGVAPPAVLTDIDPATGMPAFATAKKDDFKEYIEQANEKQAEEERKEPKRIIVPSKNIVIQTEPFELPPSPPPMVASTVQFTQTHVPAFVLEDFSCAAQACPDLSDGECQTTDSESADEGIQTWPSCDDIFTQIDAVPTIESYSQYEALHLIEYGTQMDITYISTGMQPEVSSIYFADDDLSDDSVFSDDSESDSETDEDEEEEEITTIVINAEPEHAHVQDIKVQEESLQQKIAKQMSINVKEVIEKLEGKKLTKTDSLKSQSSEKGSVKGEEEKTPEVKTTKEKPSEPEEKPGPIQKKTKRKKRRTSSVADQIDSDRQDMAESQVEIISQSSDASEGSAGGTRRSSAASEEPGSSNLLSIDVNPLRKSVSIESQETVINVSPQQKAAAPKEAPITEKTERRSSEERAKRKAAKEQRRKEREARREQRRQAKGFRFMKNSADQTCFEAAEFGVQASMATTEASTMAEPIVPKGRRTQTKLTCINSEQLHEIKETKKKRHHRPQRIASSFQAIRSSIQSATSTNEPDESDFEGYEAFQTRPSLISIDESVVSMSSGGDNVEVSEVNLDLSIRARPVDEQGQEVVDYDMEDEVFESEGEADEEEMELFAVEVDCQTDSTLWSTTQTIQATPIEMNYAVEQTCQTDTPPNIDYQQQATPSELDLLVEISCQTSISTFRQKKTSTKEKRKHHHKEKPTDVEKKESERPDDHSQVSESILQTVTEELASTPSEAETSEAISILESLIDEVEDVLVEDVRYMQETGVQTLNTSFYQPQEQPSFEETSMSSQDTDNLLDGSDEPMALHFLADALTQTTSQVGVQETQTQYAEVSTYCQTVPSVSLTAMQVTREEIDEDTQTDKEEKAMSTQTERVETSMQCQTEERQQIVRDTQTDEREEKAIETQTIRVLEAEIETQTQERDIKTGGCQTEDKLVSSTAQTDKEADSSSVQVGSTTSKETSVDATVTSKSTQIQPEVSMFMVNEENRVQMEVDHEKIRFNQDGSTQVETKRVKVGSTQCEMYSSESVGVQSNPSLTTSQTQYAFFCQSDQPVQTEILMKNRHSQDVQAASEQLDCAVQATVISVDFAGEPIDIPDPTEKPSGQLWSDFDLLAGVDPSILPVIKDVTESEVQCHVDMKTRETQCGIEVFKEKDSEASRTTTMESKQIETSEVETQSTVFVADRGIFCNIETSKKDEETQVDEEKKEKIIKKKKVKKDATNTAAPSVDDVSTQTERNEENENNEKIEENEENDQTKPENSISISISNSPAVETADGEAQTDAVPDSTVDASEAPRAVETSYQESQHTVELQEDGVQCAVETKEFQVQYRVEGVEVASETSKWRKVHGGIQVAPDTEDVGTGLLEEADWVKVYVAELDAERRLKMLDIGIQTGVLARVQHMYGRGPKVDDPAPEVHSRVSLRKADPTEPGPLKKGETGRSEESLSRIGAVTPEWDERSQKSSPSASKSSSRSSSFKKSKQVRETDKERSQVVSSLRSRFEKETEKKPPKGPEGTRTRSSSSE